jgi:hypothetical protein
MFGSKGLIPLFTCSVLHIIFAYPKDICPWSLGAPNEYPTKFFTLHALRLLFCHPACSVLHLHDVSVCGGSK